MSKAYQRKTFDEYQLWAMYDGQWCEVTAHETRGEARKELRTYQANDYYSQGFKIIKRRIKKEQKGE